MKAKANYGGLVGIVPVGGLTLQETVSIAGGESLLQRADELYESGQELDARAAVREALQLAMRRLDSVHGTGQQQKRQVADAVGEVAWELG